MVDHEEMTAGEKPLPIIDRLHPATELHVTSGSKGYRVDARIVIESVGQADAALEALRIVKLMLEGVILL